MSVQEVSDATFQTEVLDSDKPVLVDLWAVWCGPCKAIGPHVEALGNELAGQLKVTKLDVDKNPRTVTTYNVRSIPTLLLFQNGEVVDKLVGAHPKARLEAFVRKAL